MLLVFFEYVTACLQANRKSSIAEETKQCWQGVEFGAFLIHLYMPKSILKIKFCKDL